ncbi:MAG: saccharopine dehydrogenase C-terminal domain-containing protein [Chitinophagales bacterium]
MKHVLILGAGKSSASLIQYMLKHAAENDWRIQVADVNTDAAKEKIDNHSRGKAVYFDVHDAELRRKLVSENDIVLSLMPAHLHADVAKDCVELKKHFVCASYVSDAMQSLHNEAVKNDVILLNEMGLDPGIDHMSAMKMIHAAQNKGGTVTAFESYTGGLIAPENDTNPWNYKFTWNPRNVVLAGQGTAKFLQNNSYKYIPYQKLFTRYDVLEVPGYGQFEGYPNRDSLKYRFVYGLENVETLVRGTLRKKGFCDAWNVFVQLGMTDDTYQLEGIEKFSWRDLTNSFLPQKNNDTRKNLQEYLHITDESILQKLDWLSIFSDEKINLHSATPAQALQKLLEVKWKLEPGDKDMCVMLHVMEYTLGGGKYKMQSSMVSIGEDEHQTAMAKTVGLPIGISAKMILQGKFNRRGVLLPVYADLYEPVLQELENDFQVHFYESTLHL